MVNPLLESSTLPQFDELLPEMIKPSLEKLLTENRTQLDQLLDQKENFNFDTLVLPIEDISLRLHDMWSMVSHLTHVTNTEELRAAYNECIPLITDYETHLGQNKKLFNAYQQIKDSPDFIDLNLAQQKVITDALRDFQLSGVDLPENKKSAYREQQEKLAQLTTKFEENLMDATAAWTRLILDDGEIRGIPESALQAAKDLAKHHHKQGFMFTLEFPSYQPIITYADNRDLRHEFYTAYVTRASELGPKAHTYDNSEIMVDILTHRHQVATLLGFNNYAEYSLATKMASTTHEVMDFLNGLAEKSKAQAAQEFSELQRFAVERDAILDLQPWDIAYYSEKLRQHRYAISQEELRPYFLEANVLEGLFKIAAKLYGIQIQKGNPPSTWHPDVRYFDVFDQKQRKIAGFYLDLYARPHKRGGAWMDECRVRHRDNQGHLELPVTYLTCNFAGPSENTPSLLTHEEVLTLFHEFGHGLQHMLTRIDIASVSGISGVEWDAVELPSQFFENWCWKKEALDYFAIHYQTGKPLPDALFNGMIKAKNFQSAMQMVRQMELSLFDFRLHLEFDPANPNRVQQILDDVRTKIAVIPAVVFNRFQHGFAHIFGGGYAAGYYSYKWAEVLAADAFSLFEKNGIFDQETASRFRDIILAKGGSEPAMDLFVAFMGRKPKIDNLLKSNGIA